MDILFSGVLLGYVDIVQIHYLWFYLVMCILCGYIFGFLLGHVDSYYGGLLGHVDNVWIHFLFLGAKAPLGIAMVSE